MLNTNDIQFNNKNLRTLMGGAFVGGLVNSLGLGGGVIFNPLLFNLGVQPQAATATGMYMILYSSAASTLVFLTYGGLPVRFALWIGMWSVLAILISLRFIKRYITETSRPSIIVFVLAATLLASTILIPIYDIKNMIKASAAGHNVFKFGNMC